MKFKGLWQVRGIDPDRSRKLLILYGIIAITFLLIISMSVAVSVNRLQKTTFRLIEQSGETIVEIAAQAGRNSLEASYTVDNLVAERLIAIADLVGRLPNLNRSVLRDIVALNNLYGIDIMSGNGKLVMTSRMSARPLFPSDSLKPLIDGSVSVHVFSTEVNGRDLYVLALPGQRYGIVVVYFDPSYLNAIKAKISIGRIIQELGNDPGVVYIIFQDTAGIIAATENVSYMTAISADTFLLNTMRDTVRSHSRITAFQDQKIIEFVRPIYIRGQFAGLFRLGLSLEAYEKVVAAGKRQIIAFASIIAVIILLLLGLWLFSRGYSLLQTAYRELELSVEKLIEKLPIGTVFITPDLKIRTFNPLFTRYFSSRMVFRGADYAELFPDDLLGVLKAKESGQTVTIDNVTITDPDGLKRIYSIKTAPVVADSGVVGYVSIIEDITDRVEMERDRQRMRELNLIAELAAALAHDIRNPMNSIMLIAQRLMRHDDRKVSESASRIRESINRMEQQMREFLQIAAPLRLHLTDVNLADLVESIVNEWQDALKARGIVVKKELSPVKCRVDRAKLRRAIENLIDNAVKAMPEGGELTVKTYSTDAHCVIEVSDTGHGIPEDVIDQVFQPYFTTRKDGTGLGLAQVERTVRSHRGKVEVTSSPGAGTTFRIYLPKNP